MTRRETALEEYKELTDEGEKAKLIYAYFGGAIYYSQCLEETFSMMLWMDRIFKQRAKSKEEINEIIDAIEHSKKTMGNLLNEVKENYGISETHLDKLKTVLNKRNYLVHKYFKIEIQKFYSDQGRKEMLTYFGSFIDETLSIDNTLQEYFSHYKIKLGFTEERLEQLIHEMKETELKRTNEI
ncbi:hypothetical protein [Flavobacterium caeni]|uniref:Uncharacterized protein n=1 Tax=Flavobacterium caeni TaxID=490189 RepID=A0A1G5KCK2_9FLAO|nr:hypothetical protein [Flavobacterium caeni]SCY97778.1 hypothetical protein SAMN02927903_03212 [Flavobacterium caeni]